LGLDSTQFYGTLLAGKHLGKLNAFANAGLGILSNPVEAGVQNDVMVYGLGGVYPVSPAVNVVSEVYGRWNTREQGAPLGTESQSLFRLGVQISGLGFRWDIGGTRVWRKTAHSGITFGVTKEFRAFRVGVRRTKTSLRLISDRHLGASDKAWRCCVYMLNRRLSGPV
jgi:hypothetical protein